MPEDVYKILPASVQSTDMMLRDAYTGEPGAWIMKTLKIDLH